MSKGLSDSDIIAFHMKKEMSFCCPSKRTPGNKKLEIEFDDEDKPWSRKHLSSNIIKEEANQSSNSIKKEAKVVDNERARREIRKSRKQKPSGSAKKYKV